MAFFHFKNSFHPLIMKQIIFPCLFGILLSTSCKKNNSCDIAEPSTVASSTEIADMKTYLTGQGISATEHSSGLFYQISDEGSNSEPNLCSDVSVKYTGKLLNGTVFEQNNTTTTLPLANLIVGWQIGLRKIGKGGKINLYIPASLGYGSTARPGIPANSPLMFTIDLISFIN